jgi:hypothetical protein
MKVLPIRTEITLKPRTRPEKGLPSGAPAVYRVTANCTHKRDLNP